MTAHSAPATSTGRSFMVMRKRDDKLEGAESVWGKDSRLLYLSPCARTPFWCAVRYGGTGGYGCGGQVEREREGQGGKSSKERVTSSD